MDEVRRRAREVVAVRLNRHRPLADLHREAHCRIRRHLVRRAEVPRGIVVDVVHHVVAAVVGHEVRAAGTEVCAKAVSETFDGSSHKSLDPSVVVVVPALVQLLAVVLDRVAEVVGRDVDRETEVGRRRFAADLVRVDEPRSREAPPDVRRRDFDGLGLESPFDAARVEVCRHYHAALGR